MNFLGNVSGNLLRIEEIFLPYQNIDILLIRGIHAGNRSVLLQGVNDSPEIMM